MEVRSIEAIVRALNDAGVRYLVAGGVAVCSSRSRSTSARRTPPRRTWKWPADHLRSQGKHAAGGNAPSLETRE